jgi:GlpG protein
MRLIGQVADEKQARTFYNVLSHRGMDSQIEEREDGRWDVWVVSEDHFKSAIALLNEYLKNPDNPEYTRDSEAAHAARKQQESTTPAKEGEERWRMVTAKELFHGSFLRNYPVTVCLIVISVAVTLVSMFGENEAVIEWLRITGLVKHGDATFYNKTLPEIRNGQVWRLVTPIFCHFSFLHIFFNMLWLRDLGRMIEAKKGRILLLLLVFLIGAISNLGQFYMGGPIFRDAPGPMFGGMSGVVYGLLGYVWMHARFDPWAGLHVSRETVIMMIIWFFLCLSGLMGIANAAHGVGFLTGIAWGYLAALWGRRQRTGT